MTSTVFALFGLGNYLKQHPLPDDEDVVSVTSNGRNLLAILLPLLMMGSLSAGCATLSTITKPTPTVTEAQAVRNDAAVLAKSTNEALKFAIEARRRAQDLHAAGSIPDDKMIAINDASGVVGQKALDFIAFAKTVTTEASLKATAKALYGLFGDYIGKLNLAGWSGDVIRAALDAFRTYLGVK
jgi:hypothetical protein